MPQLFFTQITYPDHPGLFKSFIVYPADIKPLRQYVNNVNDFGNYITIAWMSRCRFTMKSKGLFLFDVAGG